jgi:hypothetical protein
MPKDSGSEQQARPCNTQAIRGLKPRELFVAVATAERRNDEASTVR